MNSELRKHPVGSEKIPPSFQICLSPAVYSEIIDSEKVIIKHFGRICLAVTCIRNSVVLLIRNCWWLLSKNWIMMKKVPVKRFRYNGFFAAIRESFLKLITRLNTFSWICGMVSVILKLWTLTSLSIIITVWRTFESCLMYLIIRLTHLGRFETPRPFMIKTKREKMLNIALSIMTIFFWFFSYP